MQIDTVVYFQITDPKLFAYGIESPMAAIENLTATTLRNIIGDLELDQTLTSRDIINTKMRSILDEATDDWGIKVNRVELKNIIPPAAIQESMEKQMKAERERRESILVAEGKKQSAILVAEGEKEATVLAAEANRLAKIKEAEGEAEALLTVQKALADSINLLNEAAPTEQVIKLKSLEAFSSAADGKATKSLSQARSRALRSGNLIQGSYDRSEARTAQEVKNAFKSCRPYSACRTFLHAKLSFVSDSILDRSGLECYHKLNRYAHIAGGIKLSAKHTEAELECCEEHIVHTDAVMAARSAMPAEEITTAASDFFKAFSDKTRLRILAALVSAELCVCDIASLLNMSQSAISHQLRFLKQARLVKSRKTGKTVYYALCDDHIQTILAQGIAHVQEG